MCLGDEQHSELFECCSSVFVCLLSDSSQSEPYKSCSSSLCICGVRFIASAVGNELNKKQNSQTKVMSKSIQLGRSEKVGYSAKILERFELVRTVSDKARVGRPASGSGTSAARASTSWRKPANPHARNRLRTHASPRFLSAHHPCD